MKQINQSVEVAFSCLEIQDVITVLPVMDNLANRYRECYESWKKNKDSEESYLQKRAKEAFDEAQKIWNQLQVLGKAGFVMSNPGMVQAFESIVD